MSSILTIPQYCVQLVILLSLIFLPSSGFANTNEMSSSSRVSSEQFQPYPEYGFVRKEQQSQYFTVALTGGNDYTFDVIQKNISLNDKITFVDTTFIEQFSDRIKRLALARQKLKNYLVDTNINPKFVCVVDLDDVLNKTLCGRIPWKCC